MHCPGLKIKVFGFRGALGRPNVNSFGVRWLMSCEDISDMVKGHASNKLNSYLGIIDSTWGVMEPMFILRSFLQDDDLLLLAPQS